MQFQPILNTIFSQFSQEHAPGPPRRPDKVFLAAKWLQKVFEIDFPLQRKKSYRTEHVGKKYQHVGKLFIDLNYGVFKIDSPPKKKPVSDCLISCQLKTTVFTRYVFTFSKLSSFNLIVV